MSRFPSRVGPVLARPMREYAQYQHAVLQPPVCRVCGAPPDGKVGTLDLCAEHACTAMRLIDVRVPHDQHTRE